jgi:hypothetical protein
MKKRELEKLRKEKKKSEGIRKLFNEFWPEPITTATCDKKEFIGVYPSDMKKKLAEFDYKDKHYVIYLKK